MSLRSTMTKGASYALAPKLTYSARHPTKAAAMKAASWAFDHVSPARRRRAERRSRMAGLGAAALAVPLGIWLGRRFFSHGEESVTSY